MLNSLYLEYPSANEVVYFFFIYLLLESGEEREKKRERIICVREKHQSVASCTCPESRGTDSRGARTLVWRQENPGTEPWPFSACLPASVPISQVPWVLSPRTRPCEGQEVFLASDRGVYFSCCLSHALNPIWGLFSW